MGYQDDGSGRSMVIKCKICGQVMAEVVQTGAEIEWLDIISVMVGYFCWTELILFLNFWKIEVDVVHQLAAREQELRFLTGEVMS